MVKAREVIVNDRMQKNYVYYLVAPVGKGFPPDFLPELTPKQMLGMGIFGGKYMTDCRDEFPKEWFAHARLSPEWYDPKMNFYGVRASQPLAVWRKRAGYTTKIPGVGFSGTAGISWAVDVQTTSARSEDGRPSNGIVPS